MSHRVWIGGISVQATQDEAKSFISQTFGNGSIKMWKFSRNAATGKIGRGHNFCTVTLANESIMNTLLETKNLAFKGVTLIFDAVWSKPKRQNQHRKYNQYGNSQNPLPLLPNSHIHSGFRAHPYESRGYENYLGNAGRPQPYGHQWNNNTWNQSRSQHSMGARNQHSMGARNNQSRIQHSTGARKLPTNPFPSRTHRQNFENARKTVTQDPFPNNKRKMPPGNLNSTPLSKSKYARPSGVQQRLYTPTPVSQKPSSPVSPASPPLSPQIPTVRDPSIEKAPSYIPPEEPTSPISPQINDDEPDPSETEDQKYVMKKKDFGVVTIIEEIGRSLYPIPSWAASSSIREWYKFGCGRYEGLEEVTENEFAALLHRWLCITNSVEWAGPIAPEEDVDLAQPWASTLLKTEAPSPAQLDKMNMKGRNVQEQDSSYPQEQQAMEHFL